MLRCRDLALLCLLFIGNRGGEILRFAQNDRGESVTQNDRCESVTWNDRCDAE